MRNEKKMSFQTPKKFESPKETMAKLVNFWAKPSIIKRLDTICSVSNVDRSGVLRLLVDLFLNDNEIQEKVLKEILNNDEIVSILLVQFEKMEHIGGISI